MAINAGDSDCTTGLSKAIFDALLGDARMPWPSPFTSGQQQVPKAVCYAIASQAAAAHNTDTLTVHAAYTSASGQVIPSGVATVVNFATKEEDTHDAVITGANWRFIAPSGKGGRYLVTAVCTFNGPLSSNSAILSLRVSDVERVRLARIGTPAKQDSLGGSAVVTLPDGYHVDVVLRHDSLDGGEALEAIAASNRITITRLGD